MWLRKHLYFKEFNALLYELVLQPIKSIKISIILLEEKDIGFVPVGKL